MANFQTATLPVFGHKAATAKRLEAVAAKHPEFSYTLVRNGAFLDWGIQYSFLMNATERKATIFDAGDQPFSTTTLSTVAKAVVGVFRNLHETANRAVYVHDAVVTQNELVELAKRVDPERKTWILEKVNSDEVKEKAMAELKKVGTEESIGKAMVDFISLSVYGKGYGGDFSGRTDNVLLDIKEMDRKEVGGVIADYF